MPPRVLFHIGYHKTATTWFQQEALPRHPQLVSYRTGPTREDPYLRALILASDRDFDAAAARAAFDQRLTELDVADDHVVVVSEERLSGHAATGGFDTFRIAERIAATVPDASVFFVVREQVDMIESEFLQLVQEGSVAPLAALLEFTPRLATVPGFDLGHYEYHRLAEHYASLLQPGRLAGFEFRAVVGDPQAFLRRLAEFAGVAPWPALPPEVLGRRVNPTLPRRLLAVRRAMNHFERRALNPYPLISLPPFWRGPLWWLASRMPARRRPIIDPGTQAALRKRYATSNARLAAGFGVELPVPGSTG